VRGARRAAALALALVLAAPCFAAPASAVSGAHLVTPRVSHVTLRNGLRVVVIEDHRAPLADVQMWYRFGTDDEPAAQDGLAHALEHMMFRGTHARPSGAVLGEDAERNDGDAETRREETRYDRLVPAAGALAAVRDEADRMRGLLLSERDWRSERAAILAEIRRAASDPVTVIEDAVRARAYGATSFGHGGFGDPATIRRWRAADLRRAYERAYTPDNAALVVAGDVHPAEIVAAARRLFGSIPAAQHRAPRPAQPAPARGFVVRVRAPGPSRVDIVLSSHGWAASDDNDAETVAEELMDEDHPALSDALERVCSRYAIDDETEQGGGLVHVVCTLRFGSAPDDAVAIFRRTMRSLAAHPPHALIAHAKAAQIGETAFVLDDFTREASLYGRSYALDETDPSSTDAALARVSDDRVAAVLRRWAAPIGIGIVASTTTIIPVADAPRRAPVALASSPPAARGDEESPPAASVQAESASAAAAAARELAETTSFALPNGVRVFVRRSSRNGTAYVRAGFDDPNAFGTPVEMGRGRLAEYLLAYGSRHWPYERVERVAEERGMTVELGEEMRFHGRSGDLPVMLDVLGDAWMQPSLDRDSLSTAKRGLFLAGFRMDADPDKSASMVLTRQLFRPRTSFVRALLDAVRTTPATMRAYLDRHVRPDQAWIAITGDVDAERVRAQLRRTLGAWRVPAAAAATPRPAVPAHADATVIPIERASVHLAIAQPLPPLDDGDASALLLLNEVLAGNASFDSRLMRELRVRRGLSYGVASEYDERRGAFIALLDCPPGRVAECAGTVRAVIRDLRAHPPTAGEIERARARLILQATAGASSPGGILDTLARAAWSHRAPETVADLRRRLTAVSPEAVAGAARLLDPDRLIEVDEGAPAPRRRRR
jgi:zinc protease